MSDGLNPVIHAARQYQQDCAVFLSMRQIGELLQVSSHVVGRKLKEAGLRDAGGDPTELATSNGFTRAVLVDERFVLNLWHQHKTIAILRPSIE